MKWPSEINLPPNCHNNIPGSPLDEWSNASILTVTIPHHDKKQSNDILAKTQTLITLQHAS